MLKPVTRPLETVSPSGLRCELSHRNTARAAGWAAEMSYSPVPSIVYSENGAGEHGNFLPASYKRILQEPGWKARLAKVYTGSRFLPRRTDRTRRELECANSSDALLMNILPANHAPCGSLFPSGGRARASSYFRLQTRNPTEEWR
jgi:hypothetical protein